MAAKKKKAGHTDYRTGGMFYPKFDKGGVRDKTPTNVAADLEADRKKFEAQKVRDQGKLEQWARTHGLPSWADVPSTHKNAVMDNLGVPRKHTFANWRKQRGKSPPPKLPKDKSWWDRLFGSDPKK